MRTLNWSLSCLSAICLWALAACAPIPEQLPQGSTAPSQTNSLPTVADQQIKLIEQTTWRVASREAIGDDSGLVTVLITAVNTHGPERISIGDSQLVRVLLVGDVIRIEKVSRGHGTYAYIYYVGPNTTFDNNSGPWKITYNVTEYIVESEAATTPEREP